MLFRDLARAELMAGTRHMLVRWRRTTAIAMLALCALVLASAGSAVAATPRSDGAEECTSVIGKGRIRAGKNRITLKNALSTNLAEPQALTVNLSERRQLVLTRLTSAACLVLSNKDEFNGEGEATLNGESGYTLRFSIKVSTRGRLGVFVRATGGSAPVRFRGTAMVLDSETIS
jgi:hypothetical protein